MATIEDSTGSSSGLSLAARLRDGSTGAWHELVELYGPLINDWCRRAGLPEAARADVGQEVFLAVHRGIAGFNTNHPRATFRGWLWTITRNAILQWLRRAGPMAAGGSTAQAMLAELADPEARDSAGEPPTGTEATAALLRRALEQLRSTVEPKTWAAFWSTAVLGRSAADVARELGLSAAAVRQAKSRTLRRLRQQLGDR